MGHPDLGRADVLQGLGQLAPVGVVGDDQRQLGAALPGTGAIAEYAELGNFGMRIVMSYQPNTLAQQFTVDVLYGCGVLRNTSGVQVNT